METIIQASYFIAAVIFILGLKQMSSPVTARRGILWAGAAMVLATLATFLAPEITGSDQALTNVSLIVIAIVIGGGYAWWSGKRVAMTDMPQMIAMYNGMGGGAAATIAAVELLKANTEASHDPTGTMTIADALGPDVAILGILGAIIGTVSFSGSIIAWAKLDGRLHRSKLLPAQHLINAVIAIATVGFAIAIYFSADLTTIVIFYSLALVLGIFITVPVGGADMPVIISLFNALTGLAVGFEGYVLGNAAMIIAGIVVGSAGSLLTHLMAVAMNRSVANVFFAGVGTDSGGSATAAEGEMKEIQAQDAGILMAFASQVIIIPGYGMAVAQAQHKIWELTQLLNDQGVSVKFAIHPVAGRMPGHMNVLLAEAGVPYDMIYDMEDINADFKNTTVALVIGANDVVNPSAKTDTSSPLYGMPILDAIESDNVIVIKRGRGTGFSGVENPLFFTDNTKMLFGDGQKAASELIQAVKELT
ncbi:NAD(P)(+) transhydrogenase (Re/Si-specific) subunit beta [Gammaproteobacteria bacterium]|jgi:NAD(P) transhydrogenase subunit beta|uniref:NAD(P) transhydrogenase subunit beta n=1 Tax=OM182 bacterium MED-G28 TaxID=1986256 RepID=A0A2A5W7V4_9GAMM|nr:NAD(P) transhydrogenase subunit beta [Gammaproteobacteria bacterium]MDC0222039.1 NAD(P)(+) transhydrogenase (Re/Si-specific) subunit beta [Gammaproteobacteria bacterium]PDH32492.1 MAG: NAD(P) transhydrogenase subunit beta [OM182 bacterium MED-G28]